MKNPKPTIRTQPNTTNLMTASLRLFFRLLYHSFAWSYDRVAAFVSLGRWTGWIEAIVPLLSGSKILELGFGPGHLQLYLHQNGLLAYGLDESHQMNRQAQRRIRKFGGTARLSRGRSQNLPYPAQSFACVTATFPTPYITDPATLGEVWRVLVPGGRLVVLMAAWITGRSLSERLLQTLFKVTAQVPPEDTPFTEFLAPYQSAGFSAQIRFIERPGSRLMVILASKPLR